MKKQEELTHIHVRYQDNGEGAVYFHHIDRIRDGDTVFSAGEEKRAGIRLEDFRAVVLKARLESGHDITFTGLDFEVICIAVGAEMERQAKVREESNAEIHRRLRKAEADAQAELAALEQSSKGKAERK